MKQKIFLIITIAVLSLLGIGIFNEFMANHTYYNQMFASGANWKLIVWAFVSAFIPIAYILRSKKFSIKKFLIWIVPLGLITFSIAHVLIKESIFGSSALILLILNTIILYGLGIYFLLGALSFGTWITDTFIKFKENRRQEMMIKFGIGLGVFLLIIYILTMATILWGGLTWILFLGLGFMIWRMKASLGQYRLLVEDIFVGFTRNNLRIDTWKRVGLILIGISIVYYLYGFQLSFIPYSTAWDANHAYMYEPKVLAENMGVLRGNVGRAFSGPMLWHAFITFRFSLITPIKSWFWLGPDTIAVAMNFLSGILVLLFGVGTIKEITEYFKSKFTPKDGQKNAFELAFYSGWTVLLLWLTSGMGAFLVFVDNKTDLGVMALTILALLSGFIFLKFIFDDHERGEGVHSNSLKYIVTSGVMFTWAIMAKPTAFIDVALFGLLLIALWFDWIIALGLGIVTIGLMGYMKVANAPDLLGIDGGKSFIIIGLIVAIVGFLLMFFKKNKVTNFWANKKRLLKYFVIWVLTFAISLVVLKGPNMLIKDITQGTFSPGGWAKSILLGKTETGKLGIDRTLLATTDDAQTLVAQTLIDQEAISESDSTPVPVLINVENPNLESCKSQSFTEEELQQNVRKAIAGNEDVGRYVGYGWKEFVKKGGISLGYGMLRIFYPKDGVCYGLNSDAKLLCKNAAAIESFDVKILEGMFGEVNPKGPVYPLLSGALVAYAEKSQSGVLGDGAFNPAEFKDQIDALRTYYQNHAIKTEYGKINMPYRYIIPLNVVYNRSLQNLSSYYTDIGFIRLFMFIFIILGFIYSLFHKNKNLALLTGITIVGRAIWWVIGGGIVWYGIGLIMRTILSVTLFLKDLFLNNKDERENTMFYIIIFLLAGWCVVQLFMNFIRISSQGAGGPFVWYKMNVGKTIELSDTLQQQEVMKDGYRRKDVFDLQFPHYNKIIEATNDRADEDGILIAGTYLQYFLKNQHNLKGDGMLGWFREQASDGDLCKSYTRLRNNNLKYLVIDPNIATVVMGEGNESLFDRFFAKRDPISGKIQEDGAISMLVKLWKAGYINLFGTNNLGAKYAFSLSDQEFKASFGDLSDDDLLFLRAKMAVARFFPDSQQLIGFIGTQFLSRVIDGQAIGDIADVYGKIIDETKVMNIANAWISQGANPQQMQAEIGNLTQDERFILAQYLGLYNVSQSDQAQMQEIVNNILGQSLGGSSQLIVFELN